MQAGRRTFSQLTSTFSAFSVVCRNRTNHDCHIRTKSKCRIRSARGHRLCAGGEDYVHILFPILTEQLCQHRTGCTGFHCFAGEIAVAKSRYPFPCKGDLCAQLDRLLGTSFGGSADVDVQLVQRHRAVLFLPGLQVDWLGSDDADDLTVDSNRLAQHHSAVDFSDVGKAQQTVLPDSGQHKACLVHVCGNHHPLLCRFLSFFVAEQVSPCIHPPLAVSVDFLNQQLAHLFLPAGDCICHAQSLYQFNRCLCHFLLPPMV